MICCMLDAILIEKKISKRNFAIKAKVREFTVIELCNQSYKGFRFNLMDALCRELKYEPGMLFQFLDSSGKIPALQSEECEIGNKVLYCGLGQILKKRGKQRKWLAEEANIRPSTVSSLCNNKSKWIEKDALQRICTVLGCSIGDIFYYVNPIQIESPE